MSIDRVGGGAGPIPDSLGPVEEAATPAVGPVESRPAGQAPVEAEDAAPAQLTGEGETVAKFDEVMTQGEVMKVKLDDQVGDMPTPIPEPTDRQIVQEIANQPDPVPQGVKEVIAQQLADRPVQQAEQADEKRGLVSGLAAPPQQRPDLAQFDHPVEEAEKADFYLEKGPALKPELFKPRQD
jgi:hypothetical protein